MSREDEGLKEEVPSANLWGWVRCRLVEKQQWGQRGPSSHPQALPSVRPGWRTSTFMARGLSGAGSQGEAAISKTSVSSFRQLAVTEQASQVTQW